MKKNAITILLFLLSAIVAYSQLVIENPKTGLSLMTNAKITKLELTDSTTILHFHTRYTPGWWINIPKETYIQPVGSEKLFIQRTEGIPLNKRYTMPASGEVSYKLIFPAVAKTTQYIDYGEANDGGSWFIYDIAIKASVNESQLPKELTGEWFNKTTGEWEFGFYDTHAVYKNKLWSYSFPKNKKTSNSIKLTGHGKTFDVFYKTVSPGNILLGLSPQSLKSYNQNAAEAKKKKPADDKPYALPVFRIDSATYSGYIKGYTPRVGVKTLSVSIDDIITGMQNTFVVRIDKNGFFSTRLPVYYPHICYVRSPLYNGSVFLEPGKEVFQLLGTANQLFMGESAKINSDMFRLLKIRSLDYRDIQRKILDMSPAQYKTYCNNLESKDMNEIDSITRTNGISAKAYQVMKMETSYHYAGSKMEYDYYWENAYREKNNIPRTQRTLPVKPDSLTAQYFDFINNESVNNPLAILSSAYDSYLNKLKYLDILQGARSFTWNTPKIAADLEKSGYTLTDSEKSLIKEAEEIELILNSAEQKSFNEKYSKRISDFYTKYQEDIQKLYKNNPTADLPIYFKENNIKVTDDEQALLNAMAEHSKSESTVKLKQKYTKAYGDSISAFNKRHADFVNEQFYQQRNTNRKESLNKLFNIEPGLGMDIISAQDICRKILEEVSPVSDKKLKAIQQQFSNPFVVEYVQLCNNQAIAKLEANKKKTGFVVNETPKTEADRVFDAIIQKYKGKVIYVDFWATWCGPCRGGIERIKPLKEEVAGKDIVFVYITNPSSPQNTWSNMIPDIKGEHYRVTTDEWNFLSSKFNISGIPHYVLVGKTGDVLNPKLGHLDNAALKTLLEKHLNE